MRPAVLGAAWLRDTVNELAMTEAEAADAAEKNGTDGADGKVGDLSLETAAVPGEADNLLDKILKNALAPKVKPEGVKKEGVKSEVKSELIKSEVKTEKGIKQEKLDAPALPDIDGAGRLKKRSRSRKKNKKKKSKSRKRRRKSSSSSRSLSKSPVQAALDGLPQARVVAVRGHFAQYLSPAGETFYKNVLTGEIIWQKPGNFDCQPSRRAGEMTPAPGEAACYIFHMPPEWSESDLMQLFAPFGQVTAAHVQRDANGFSRSCGFVTYASSQAAEQASNMMNGFGVDGKFLKVSLTQAFPDFVVPSFGIHPWWAQRSDGPQLPLLRELLEKIPTAGVGYWGSGGEWPLGWLT
eukprot:s84_g17.t2